MSRRDEALSKNIAILPRLALILCLVIFLAACGGTPAQIKNAPPSQTAQAHKLINKAKAGDPIAQYFLGRALIKAAINGDHELLAPGTDWIRRSAEQGFAKAEARMGELYVAGLGVPTDPAIAVEWFTRAAQNGDEYAQYNLGISYLKGKGIGQNPIAAEKWLRKAADQGNKKAEQALEAIGLETVANKANANPLQAVAQFKQAAATGDTIAMYNLGTFYLKGHGVAQNNAEAVKWYRKAADLGLPIAQYDLGTHYSQGTAGLRKDARKATAYFQQAADQGFASAQASLGFIYVTGQLGKADPELAVKWFRKSSLQDNVEGNYNLGLCYLNGTGVSRDIGRAEKLIERAADQNHLLAQVKLMELYTAGTILPQDLVKAYKWMVILTTKNPENQTNPQSAALFSQGTSALAASMSESQLKRARQLVAEWKPVP